MDYKLLTVMSQEARLEDLDRERIVATSVSCMFAVKRKF